MDLFCKDVITVEDRYFASPNMHLANLAKKEIHRLTAAHCTSYNIIFDFSQQDYQVWSATEVHVGLLQASTTW